ncbi:MAG: malectin domain-containing carbohydrate-binding protein [Planctomycetota bacterium]
MIYRINAGGPSYRDAQSQLWSRDTGYFNTGVARRRQSLGGSPGDPIYHSERYDTASAPEMSYRFPLVPGLYQVRLHFSEIVPRYGSVGARVFDVALEGQVLLPAFDIFGVAGFDVPHVVQLDDVRVDDQLLDIDFTRINGDPKISAIEIIQTVRFEGSLSASPGVLDFGALFQNDSSSPQTITLRNDGDLPITIQDIVIENTVDWQLGATPPIAIPAHSETTIDVTFAPVTVGELDTTLALHWEDSQSLTGELEVALQGEGREPLPSYTILSRYNAGGASLTDPGGKFWESDSAFANTGNSRDLGVIGGPAQDDIYKSDRTDPAGGPELRYRFPVEPGQYVLRLHFLERRAAFAQEGARVFDVSAEGEPLLTSYDIYRWAGFGAPIVEEYVVDCFDGLMEVDFGHVTGDPVVSGLEIGLARLFHGEIVASPDPVSFVDVYVGDHSAERTVQLMNTGDIDLMITGITSSDPVEFPANFVEALPIVLPAGESTDVLVSFAPQLNGERSGSLTIFSDDPDGDLIVGLEGFGAIPQDPVTIYRVNAGGSDWTDPSGNLWLNDGGFYNSGSVAWTSSEIANTELDTLYQSERWDPPGAPDMTYTFPLDPGRYRIRLHFAEIYHDTSGKRVFDVLLEGDVVSPSLDVLAQAGGKNTALVLELEEQIEDGALELTFGRIVDSPKISAVEIALLAPLAQLEVSPSGIDFGHVKTGEQATPRTLVLSNPNPETIRLDSLTFHVEEGGGQEFSAEVDGQVYWGAPVDVEYPLSLDLRPGGELEVPVIFRPTVDGENRVHLIFGGSFDANPVPLHGAGGEGHPFLHVVIVADEYTVDYDQDGQAPVELVGSDSHTHEVGHVLTAFEWAENGIPFAQEDNIVAVFPTGEHDVSLTIWDDNDPPESLTGFGSFSVVPPTDVPGVLVQYYDASASSPDALLDALPPNADWIETKSGFSIDDSVDPFAGQLVVQMLGRIDLATDDTYDFQVVAGGNSRLYLDGSPVTGPQALLAGIHTLEARFAVNTWADLPLEVTMSVAGGEQVSIDSGILTHDRTTMLPVINTYPTEGFPQGGYGATLSGLGFFPDDQVVVHWGNEMIQAPALSVEADQLDLVVPPGTGTVTVFVATPNGTSNSFDFTYTETGPPPIQFDVSELVTTTNPTAIAWGPDSRLYVANVYGTITAYSFDDDYNITGTQVIPTIAGLTNTAVLGLGFNPHEPSDPVRLYVAHNEIYANGGTCFEGFSPYSGQISVLTGPSFDVVTPVVTGLPVSNHDHAINGLTFDNAGDLIFLSGSNTNAGVPACPHGGLDESPLSAAVLKAWITRQNFNGAVTYVETGSGLPNDDQSFGHLVDVAPGVDVEVFAPGVRNPFDLVYTTKERIYATDNGPNAAFGEQSTGPDSQDVGPTDWDELLLIEADEYYGAPNRNRGRTDPRQNVYHWTWEGSIPGTYTRPLSTFHSSTDGILEYRATSFQSALRGKLLAQKWNGQTYLIELSSDGRSVVKQSNVLTNVKGLDLVQVPGGLLIASDYSNSRLIIARPVDVAQTPFSVVDVFPWRAPATGGNSFEIAGTGFGSLQDTSVTIGGLSATLTEVTPTRIRGTVPVNASPTAALVDVSVTVAGQSRTIPEAFRFLF